MDPRLRRALSQALRVEILERIASRPSTAAELAEMCGEQLARVTYHLWILQDAGCIRPAEPAPPDPAQRTYEIATLIPGGQRLPLSDSARGHALAAVLQRLLDSGVAALDAGTLGKRDHSRVSCESAVFDEQGWREAKAIVDEANERLGAVRRASERRLGASHGAAIRATIAFVAFEAPHAGGSAQG